MHTQRIKDKGIQPAFQLLAVKTNNVHSQLGHSAGLAGSLWVGETLSLSLTVNKCDDFFYQKDPSRPVIRAFRATRNN